jgi:WG containing repeat
MQKSLFILFFLALTTTLFGQSKPDKIEKFGTHRVETYFYNNTNYVNHQFTIKGQADTILTESFGRNGRLVRRSWGLDSVFTFSNQGLIEKKMFYGEPILDPYNRTLIEYDSTMFFYPNGQIASIETQKRGVFKHLKKFDKNGQIDEQKEGKRVGKYGWSTVWKDSLNRVLRTSFSDTLLVGTKPIYWNYDTVFYKNKQPYLIHIRNGNKGNIKTHFYDENGGLSEAFPPDSLRLTPFKDNVDCYYGLKNKRGDTIFKPHFDRIKFLDNNLIAVYEGDRCRLMNGFGVFLTMPPISSVKKSNYYTSPTEREREALIGQHSIRGLEYFEIKNYFDFWIGDKQGVIDRKGQVVMPPQYKTIEGRISDSLWAFSRTFKGQLVEKGYARKDGSSLFPNYAYTVIEQENTYFKVSHSIISPDFPPKTTNVWGLINQAGTLLLPCQFDNIHQIGNSDLFEVFIKNDDSETTKNGIFDAKKRHWVIDTSGTMSLKYTDPNGGFFIIKEQKTQKEGIIDAKGNFIVPAIYDTLTLVDKENPLFIAQKGAVFQFINLNKARKRPTYTFLKKVDFNNYASHIVPQTQAIFLAKHKNKWGVVDSNDRILLPFTADYASISEKGFYLVTRSKVNYFDQSSFPREQDISWAIFGDTLRLQLRELADDVYKIFFFNAQSQLVIPPQYRAISRIDNDPYSHHRIDYILVEDAQKHRKLILKETGAITDFPFDYQIKVADTDCKIIVVADEKLAKPNKFPQNLGVVTFDGRLLTPCVNADIAIANPRLGTYFVRRDTPTVDCQDIAASRDVDTLTECDNGWYFYNSDGKLIDNKPFNYPIDFENGFGIGVQGGLFGIFQSDGRVVVPPQYMNIRYDKKTGFYYLYRNQGLKVTASLKNNEGKTIVEEGRYEGFSLFQGKYAFVSSGEKLGLIDTLGNEIIAPQDLYTANSNNLMDSINLFNKELRQQADSLDDHQEAKRTILNKLRPELIAFDSYSESEPDNMDISPILRNSVWHLMLEKIKDKAMLFAEALRIERTKRYVGDCYTENMEYRGGRIDDWWLRFCYCRDVQATEKTVSFILRKNDKNNLPWFNFYNFYKEKDRWKEIHLTDLLSIEGEKYALFNALLIQKVKELQDVDIDCSNTAEFLNSVSTRFVMTQYDLKFYFEPKDSDEKGRGAVVYFSWRELKGFLKLKVFEE